MLICIFWKWRFAWLCWFITYNVSLFQYSIKNLFYKDLQWNKLLLSIDVDTLHIEVGTSHCRALDFAQIKIWSKKGDVFKIFFNHFHGYVQGQWQMLLFIIFIKNVVRRLCSWTYSCCFMSKFAYVLHAGWNSNIVIFLR